MTDLCIEPAPAPVSARAAVPVPVPVPDRPFRPADLPRLGVSRATLRGWLGSGAVRSPFRGVFVPTALVDGIETRAAAAALVLSEHHVLTDRSAAWLHGIDVYAYAELATVPPVETCVRRGHTPTRLRGTRGRTRDLAEEDVMRLHGVPVTTPLRTALDLGCNLRRREAMAALNAFARHHGVTAAELSAELERLRGRRGVVQLRALIGLLDPRAESHRESWVWLEIHDRGLPSPDPQFWIEIDGVPTYRLDFAYPRARVCVEYDGVEFHDQTPEQRHADAERRAWLREHGWTVIVVGLGDFTGEALERWIAELREALRAPYTTRRF